MKRILTEQTETNHDELIGNVNAQAIMLGYGNEWKERGEFEGPSIRRA